MLTKKSSVSQLVFEPEGITYLENITIFEDGKLLGRIRPIRRVVTQQNRNEIYAEISRGEWDDETEYTEGDVIFYEGGYYIALQNSTNVEPTETLYWEELPLETEEEAEIKAVREAISAYKQDRLRELDEASAQKYSDLIPMWEPWIRAKEHIVYKYDDKFFLVRTPHITQPTWTPDVAVALWQRVHLGDTPPEWTQPLGAHDAYPYGFTVIHGGSTWTSNIDANVWEPGAGDLWTEVAGEEEEPGGEEPDGPEPWVQPTGDHDAYNAGATVTHNGQTWVNIHGDGNVWEPGVFGWEVVE